MYTVSRVTRIEGSGVREIQQRQGASHVSQRESAAAAVLKQNALFPLFFEVKLGGHSKAGINLFL